MVAGGNMSQGDFVQINSKSEIEKRLPFLLKRIEGWDYSSPLVLKLEQYQDPRSLSQNALFHVWCGQMSEHFIKKIPTATKDNLKMMMKQRFLGTYDIKIGKTSIEGQVKSTTSLKKGEMVNFMDQVYHWGLDNGVLLTVPEDSEYQRLKAKQDK